MYPIIPNFGITKNINAMLEIKSKMFIFKTEICLSKPFKIASTTLSMYIIGTNGASSFIYGDTEFVLYINRLSCSENKNSKTAIVIEKINVYFSTLLEILFIVVYSDLVLNWANSGISKLLKVRTIVLGNKIRGMAIPEISP